MASIKITSAKSGTGDLEQYLKKEEKTEKVLMTGKDCNIDNFARDFEITKNINRKTTGRQHFHIIQSFAPGETNPGQAHGIGKDFIKQAKFNGFQVALVTHTDKEHIHNHIVVNSVNFETGSKFQQSKKDLYVMRDFSDKLCLKQGLSVIEKRKSKDKIITYDIKKYKIIEKHEKGQGESYILQAFIDVKNVSEKSKNKDEFVQQLKDLGYSTTWTEKRKNVTFEIQETGKKVRLSNLEKTFSDESLTKEGLEQCFGINKECHKQEKVKNEEPKKVVNHEYIQYNNILNEINRLKESLYTKKQKRKEALPVMNDLNNKERNMRVKIDSLELKKEIVLKLEKDKSNLEKKIFKGIKIKIQIKILTEHIAESKAEIKSIETMIKELPEVKEKRLKANEEIKTTDKSIVKDEESLKKNEKILKGICLNTSEWNLKKGNKFIKIQEKQFVEGKKEITAIDLSLEPPKSLKFNSVSIAMIKYVGDGFKLQEELSEGLLKEIKRDLHTLKVQKEQNKEKEKMIEELKEKEKDRGISR